ncbi:kinase-like domain-containing protein [Mycena metata]|uniref:Kinase-like domain-containing protein n=1 Tax=Mycena metata TaxID=1033252 RepID=A0AAD7MUY7_9AGAR|nr:kinase-like domain-containing protein [Mycena metata]
MGSPENTHLEFINSHSLNGRIIPDSWDPFAVGASANVYKGTLFRPNGHKIPVAIKMLLSNRNDGDQEYTLKQLKREANIWAPLNHKHLVPFLGICDDISRWPCLISPLYNHGHVGKFIRNNPTANRGALILGVALGLEYLHEKDIIHGDLKVANVFVDEDSIPRIADFGISKIVNRRGYTTWSIGTPSYMAPELFHVLTPTAEKEVYPRTTKSSDVYSFNLLALEISISKPPRGRPSRPFLTVEQLSGLRPQRMDYSTVPDETWSILDRGWELEPNDRPTISELRLQLSSAFDNTKG